MKTKENKFMLIIFPIILAVLLTIPFYVTDLDIAWQKLFYKEGKWYLDNLKIVKFFYNYGPVPGILSALIGVVFYILSFFISSFRDYRKIALFVFLYMLVGSGIIVNAIFKEYWGRPRPRQIVEFGGEANYIPPVKKGKLVLSEKSEKMLETKQGAVGWDKFRDLYKIKGKYNSFPAGHASVGFFMMFPFFYVKKRKTRLFWLYFGIIYGLIMGIGRNIQGGHFLSDVIWAGFMMYFTGIAFYYIFGFDKSVLYKKKRNHIRL
ncbi:MAG: phosphoesterase PA-phosphatase related [Fusobacteriales bacterium]|jgi:membrane-associated PAP2 superfamily phosphatase|nr:phosphoesterase PA-phosphatase related [Fusobacteriales bacterium]